MGEEDGQRLSEVVGFDGPDMWVQRRPDIKGGDFVRALVTPRGPFRQGSATLANARDVGLLTILTANAPWETKIPALAVGDLICVGGGFEQPKAAWEVEDDAFRRRVALMRELGVVRYAGIALDPAWRPEAVVAEDARALTPAEVHTAYWRRLTRSSGAPPPACSAFCACGAKRGATNV